MIKFRSLTIEDQEQLWNWLHIALWDPPPAGLRRREVLQEPRIRIYAENWGQPDDIGIVAVLDGKDIGACWMRQQLPGIGLASVDKQTLQLGIALLPEYQRQGYGTKLMQTALEAAYSNGFRKVSLTVHPDNPAILLYTRCGFKKIDVRNGFDLMLRIVE